MTKRNALTLAVALLALPAMSCSSMMHKGQKIQPGMDQGEVFTRLGDPVLKEQRGDAEYCTWFKRKTVCVISFVDRKVESRSCFKEGQTPMVIKANDRSTASTN